MINSERSMHMDKVVKIGFLGCGNVGSGVWRLLREMEQELSHRNALKFEVKRVLVRDKLKQRSVEIPHEVLTENPDDVLLDPDISIVMEFLGGESPAYKYLLTALENGKTVVTANKVAFALHWHELHSMAKKQGVGLYYEAAVCGAIPVIHILEDSLQANRVDYIYGIVNGTTNYILSRMQKENLSYPEVLLDAQKLGLAEPDPASDVEGFDTAYKLSILASLAFHGRVPFEYVHIEGITKIQREDIVYGEALGYTLKLLAIAKREGLQVETRVHPTFLKKDHPLASINGSFNAVYLNGNACKEMMLMGRGAGDLPTASALVSDLVRASMAQTHFYPTFDNTLHPHVKLEQNSNWECKYYIRMNAVDRPGVLSQITQAFASEEVSIEAMQQYGKTEQSHVTIVFITHKAHEKSLQKAVNAIDVEIATVESLIRVE